MFDIYNLNVRKNEWNEKAAAAAAAAATLKGNLTFQTKFSDKISTSILQYFYWFPEIIVHITLCVCQNSQNRVQCLCKIFQNRVQ
jgi:hypothetical protein